MSFFRLPTRVRIEPGCLASLPDVVAELGAERIFLVTDSVLLGLAFSERALEALRSQGLACEVFAAVEANPRTTTVERIAEEARAFSADVLVGLGGGSVMDAAKAGAMLATNGGRLLDYVGKERFRIAPLPFVAIPTTCGTGSEVTWVAVVTDAASGSKVSVKGNAMFPRAALVDAELLSGLPSGLVASTGMDALTHAIEAVTGRLANPVSDALGTEAVERLLRFLPRAAADPAGDAEARAEVLCAATLAGMAFGNSDVGAVHCLSETLGGLYDVPHGLANAILLAPVQRDQLAAARASLERLEARVAGGAGDAARFVERLEDLTSTLSIPAFASLGVPRERFPEIAEHAVANGSNDSCPQPMARADYERILSAL